MGSDTPPPQKKKSPYKKLNTEAKHTLGYFKSNTKARWRNAAMAPERPRFPSSFFSSTHSSKTQFLNINLLMICEVEKIYQE